jgi:multidrug efflux system membrane fusion protein
MQAMPIEVPLRGKTKAKSVVSVVPETQGIVRAVHVHKGETVAVGDPICTIDPGTRLAAVEQAQAAVDQATTALNTNKSLRDKGLAPANSGLQLEAALKAAQSGLDNAKAEWGRTDVKAPVPGVIQDPLATVGSMAAGGAPCATIVQLNPMLFVGAVPEARIAYASLGLPATVTTVNNQTVEGKVSYISSIADPATRSFAIEIEVPNPSGKVLDGLTASAIVKVGTAPAHLLPQSVLTLDDDGVLGIRAVQDSKVAFFPVTILKDTREGVWVTGLPPKVDVITIGQEYVQSGQVVNASYGPSDAPAKVAEGAQS